MYLDKNKHKGKKPCHDCGEDLVPLTKIAHCLDNLMDDKFHCGLPTLKKELAKIDYKLNYILDLKTKYGLYSIKNEITSCSQHIKENLPRIERFNNVLTHAALTLKGIKKVVDKTADTVNDPQFGLKEIKCEVRGIEKGIERLEQTVANPVFGLKEIKREICMLENSIGSPTTGLAEIKSEVAAIEAEIFSPTVGLSEIKAEVASIEALMTTILPQVTMTTGPFLKDNDEQTLHLKALNYTNQPQSVTFVLHDLSNCPLTHNATVIPLLDIAPGCSAATELSIGTGQRDLEIRAERNTTQVFLYAATKTNANTGGKKRSEIRHTDWAPLATFCG